MDVVNTVFRSDLMVDKILGTWSGSFTLNGPSSAGTATVTRNHTTSASGTVLFVGMFSLNGGSTWNGLQTHVDHADRTQGEVFIWGESTNNTLTIKAQNSRSSTATRSYNYTVQYKIAAIAKPDQILATPQPIGTDTFFISSRNYQKIAVDNVRSISGTNAVYTVNHNLGYRPRVRTFIETGGVLRSRGYYQSARTNSTTSSCATYVPGTVSGKLYTRIYYDE